MLILSIDISVQCASAIDNMASFYFNNITAAEGPPSQAALSLARHVAECPNLFPEVSFSIICPFNN